MNPKRFRGSALFWLVWLACVALLVLAGCATTLQPNPCLSPKSFDERLICTYGAVTATRYSCADAVKRGRLDRAGAAQCLVLTDHARRTLDASRALADTNEQTSALAQLELATSVLTGLERMLQERVQP